MRRFMAFVLAGLMALMPLSVLASYPSGAADAPEMPCHSQDVPQPDDGPGVSCAHLQGCCAGFLAPAIAELFDLPAARQRTQLGEDVHAGCVPDQLDRPPVIL
jgi:hypothetical protein